MEQIAAAIVAEVERHNREMTRLIRMLQPTAPVCPRSMTRRDQVRSTMMSGPKTVKQIADATGLCREEVRNALKGCMDVARWETALGEIAYGFDSEYRERHQLPSVVLDKDGRLVRE